MKQYYNAAVFYQWQKLNSRLQYMRSNGMLKKLPYQTRISLLKKWKRHLKKLFSVKNTFIKALNVFCVATSLSVTANAQCNIFSTDEVNNPIKKISASKSLFNASFIDIDNDGDLDCYENYVDASSTLHFTLLRNIGTPKVPQYKVDTADGFPKEGVGTSTRWNNGLSRFADIDGDGDYDCFISVYNTSSFGYSEIDFYENTGTKTKPNFVRNYNNPLNIHGHYFIVFNLADVDGDGDYDMVYGDIYYSKFFENVGTKTNPLFVQQYGSNNPFEQTGLYGYESFYDWNKDGLPDYGFSLSGYYYRNVGTVGNAKYVQDKKGPKTTLGFDGQWLDINNDNYPEIITLYADMETTSPQAKIIARNIGDSAVKLTANPTGNYLYRWRKRGKIIQGETSSSIIVRENGYYTVEIKDSCGVGTSLPYNVSSLSNKINNENASDENNSTINTESLNARLFPNPFTSEITIKLQSAPALISTIKIADVNGKIVSTFTTTANTINAGKQLPAGIYFIQVIQNNAVVYKQKIIKQ